MIEKKYVYSNLNLKSINIFDLNSMFSEKQTQVLIYFKKVRCMGKSETQMFYTGHKFERIYQNEEKSMKAHNSQAQR